MKVQFTTFGIRFRRNGCCHPQTVKGLLKIGKLRVNFAWPSFDLGYETRDVFDDGEYVFPMFHLGPIAIMWWGLDY